MINFINLWVFLQRLWKHNAQRTSVWWHWITLCILQNLDKWTEKETHLHLHAVILNDYLIVKRIPWGLRINKGPLIGRNNENLCDQWSKILNKCLKLQLESDISDSIKLNSLIKDCEQRKAHLVAEITAVKKRKFDRDTADYENGRIYQWRQGFSHKSHYRKIKKPHY